MLNCSCSGTRTRCCAGTPVGCGTSQPTGPGSPRWQPGGERRLAAGRPAARRAGRRAPGRRRHPVGSRTRPRVLRVDGTLGWTFSRAIPLQDANGEIVEWLGAASDITGRKQAQEALAASESRLRALLNSASQGVVAIDESGRMVLVNVKIEEMFGYTRDELLGQPLEVMLPERYRTAHDEDLQRYFAHPHTRVMGLGIDLCGRSKNGVEFPVEVSLSWIEQGGSRLAMAIITD